MAMQDRKSIVMASVNKLLKLGLPDEEIVKDLAEVGISQQEAEVFIREAKGLPKLSIPPLPEEKPAVKRIKKSQEEVESGLEALEEVPEELPQAELPESFSDEETGSAMDAEEEDEKEKDLWDPDSRKEVPIPKAHESHAAGKQKTVVVRHAQEPFVKKESFASLSGAASMDQLWEKGILQTVNSRLQEMRELKQELDAVLDQKVEAAFKRQMQKLDALMESRQTLMVAKLNAQLEAKSKDISDLLDSKIREVKKSVTERDQALTSFEAQKELIRQTFVQVSKELAELQKQRKQSVVDLNAALLKQQQQLEDWSATAKQKLHQLEERATQTLQLETSVIDGVVKDAANKVDQTVAEKMGVLSEEVQESISELEALKGKIDAAHLDNQLKSLEETKKELREQLEQGLQIISTHTEERVEKQLKNRLKTLDEEYQNVVKKASMDIIQQQLAELKDIKEELKQELVRLKQIE